MELTSQMMASIISSVPDTPAHGRPDARKSNRIGLSTCLSFAIPSNGAIGTPTTVLARNLSRTGISILISTELLVGQEFVVWLPTAQDQYAAIHCEVAWCEALGRTSFIAGGFYTRIGTPEESALNLLHAEAARLPSPAPALP